MRTLIAGTSYIRNPDSLWLAEQWSFVNNRLNPNSDLLIVDTPGPMEWRPAHVLGVTYFHRFSDNIGHLAEDGYDGWGRASMWALDFAVKHDYDYVALFDLDILMTVSWERIFDMMEKNGWVALGTEVKTGPYDTAPNCQGWLEGIHGFNVKYLEESKFTERYDWPNMQRDVIPEQKIRDILGSDLTLYPFTGLRNDFGIITARNIWEYYTTIDYITHCSDHGVYREILGRYSL